MSAPSRPRRFAPRPSIAADWPEQPWIRRPAGCSATWRQGSTAPPTSSARSAAKSQSEQPHSRPVLGGRRKIMENRRTESAREHDDSELIESIEPTPSQEGRSGGSLQEDIATQAELERVRDPEAREGVNKKDD